MYVINKNEQVGPDFYLLEVRAPDIVGPAEPGQFIHLRVNTTDRLNLTYDPLLRRPFSIHDADKEEGLLRIIYRAVGRGTELMTDLAGGDRVDLLGPLGNGFNTDLEDKNIIIAGGGMGLAPLYFLVKNLLAKSNNILLLMGGNTGQELAYFAELFSAPDLILKVATMDGSRGLEGSVIDLWNSQTVQDLPVFKSANYIYACGPEIVLQKIQTIAAVRDIPGQMSVERRMGCGIGVCLSCSCKTETGNKRACKEGPVLSLDEVIFNE